MVYLCVQRKNYKLEEEVYISLGSNKGNRVEALRSAVKEMKAFARVLRKSPIYETPPWGFFSEQPFLNAVVKLETELEPNDLLGRLLEIEKEQGRHRSEEKAGYEDRTLDLDILFYGDRLVDNGHLQIPHPRMEKRKFILVPLCDIAPDFKHPKLNRSIKDLLGRVEDESEILRTAHAL